MPLHSSLSNCRDQIDRVRRHLWPCSNGFCRGVVNHARCMVDLDKSADAINLVPTRGDTLNLWSTLQSTASLKFEHFSSLSPLIRWRLCANERLGRAFVLRRSGNLAMVSIIRPI